MAVHHWALLPFVTGILVGLSVSTVFLIRPYTEHVVTNVYIDVMGGGDNGGHTREVEERLQRYEELMRELHPVSHVGTGPVSLSEETIMKDLVHYAVLVDENDMIETLRHTWALDIPEAKVSYFVSSEDTAGDQEMVGTETNVVTLSRGELHEIQVLQYVCDHKMNSTKWFFFGYDTSYVKTQELESYLLTLEGSQEQLLYLGKPVKREPIGRLCLPGPGSVLSYQALTQLCPKLGGCRTMREEDLKTECVLGECIHKQLPHVQCNKEGYPQSLFLRFDAAKKGPIIDPKNKVILNRALAIYPVPDPKLMYNIHQLVVSKRLNDSQHFAQELKQVANQMTAFLPRSESTHTQGNGDVIKSRTDIVSWNLINHNKLMVKDSDDPAIQVSALWSQELNTINTRTMEYLSVLHEDQQMILDRVVNAYWRHHPSKGMEYIVDFETKSSPSQENENPSTNRFCAYLSRSYNPPEVSPLQPQVRDSKRVTIAIVMTGDQIDALEIFMKDLSQVLSEDQRLDLIVVKMRTSKDRQGKNVDLDSVIHPYETQYLRASFKTVNSPYILSRSHGLAMVLHEVRPTDVLFLADLYLTFNASFLERCRNLPLQGQQVYYPIPFATESDSTDGTIISSAFGHWLVKSHGMGCVYAADVLSSMQAGSKGIPKEVDSEILYRRLLEKDYEVIRSVDSGLWRRQVKESDCELHMVGDEQELCEVVAYGELRDKTQLSEMLFDHEGTEKF